MSDNEKILIILDSDNVPSPAFIKANNILITENKDNLKKYKNFKEGLIDLWKIYFDADLVINDNPSLIFKSKRKKEIFLVKYS